MSAPTAPKLTYAKIGNKSKNKIQAASGELLRGQEQASQDLFAHMNQDNLSYIKKELKLKKNRSEHDKSRFSHADADSLQEQVTQRDRVYHKYNKGEEQLSERQPYLQETQRKSSEERPVNIQIADQAEEGFTELVKQDLQKATGDERRGLSTSHNAQQARAFTRIPQGKMYQSLPYEEPKKRMVSIEGYFRESVSTNLQKHREQGHQFIEFLSDYISDLNQSKHLKSRPQESEISIDKKKRGRKQSQQSEERIREDLKKMDRLKRNSDTFGEPNSKYTVHSISYQSQSELQMQLKRERFNCIVLAKDVQTLREELLQKDTIIKNLRVQNELLQEEITHLRTKQQIIMKSKGEHAYESRARSKHNKHVNDENFIESSHNHFVHSHHRHGSVNPSAHRNDRTGYSSRDLPPQPHQNEFAQTLFRQFESSNKPKDTARKDESRSIQKLQNQYINFVKNTKNPWRPYK